MEYLKCLMIIGFALLTIACDDHYGAGPLFSDSTQVQGIQPDTTIKDGNITVYRYSDSTRTVAVITVPDTVYFLYTPVNSKLMNVIGWEGNWRYLINATYFSGTYSDAKQVGWLWVYGKYYEPIADDPKQLTHVVSINRSNREVKYTYYKDFIPSNDSNYLEFQTGPLVVENNKLAENYIKSSINGLRNAQRTLLASTDNRQLYFIVTMNKVTLPYLGDFLLKLSVFQGKNLNVVNLDGGPSSALYSKNVWNINWNSFTQLPLLLGIH